jgi:hypothetical protein
VHVSQDYKLNKLFLVQPASQQCATIGFWKGLISEVRNDRLPFAVKHRSTGAAMMKSVSASANPSWIIVLFSLLMLAAAVVTAQQGDDTAGPGLAPKESVSITYLPLHPVKCVQVKQNQFINEHSVSGYHPNQRPCSSRPPTPT